MPSASSVATTSADAITINRLVLMIRHFQASRLQAGLPIFSPFKLDCFTEISVLIVSRGRVALAAFPSCPRYNYIMVESKHKHLRYNETMLVRRNGKLVKVTKRSIGAVSPSSLRVKRDAFERKKKTAAFKRWRKYQYRVTQKGVCYYCSRPIAGAWHTDHIVPLFRGGTSAYNNLCVSCGPCNIRKGIKIL